MYTPAHNRNEDRDELLAFMRAHSFATLVTAGPGGLMATHLPFLIEAEGGQVTLVAHLARANPQARELPGAEALVIFQGPHAYISPFHYEREEAVPTWNYIAVHATGPVHVLASLDERAAAVRRLIAVHDPAFLARYDGMRPAYREGMLGGIVAFAIPVARLDARWKLSQDKSETERARIATSLGNGEGPAAAIGRAMRERLAR